jgi:hypothetical protein
MRRLTDTIDRQFRITTFELFHGAMIDRDQNAIIAYRTDIVKPQLPILTKSLP